MTKRLLLVSIFITLLTGCAGTNNMPAATVVAAIASPTVATLTTTPAAPPTATETIPPMPTETPTATPTHAPTITSTPSPTIAIWVESGTPISLSGAPVNAENGAQLTELARWGRGVISDVDLSADGQWLAVAAGSGVYIHLVADLQAPPLAVMTSGNVTAVAISPSGDKVALVLQNGGLQLWQTNPIKMLSQADYQASQILFSPGGDILVITTNDGVHAWVPTTEEFSHTYPGMLKAAISTDGLKLAVWDYGSVRVHDMYSGVLLSEATPIVHLESRYEQSGLIVTDAIFHGEDLVIVAPQVFPNGFTGPVEIQKGSDASLLFAVHEYFRLSEATKYVCNEPVFYWDPPEPAVPWNMQISLDGRVAGLHFTESGFSDDYNEYSSLRFYQMTDGKLLYKVEEGIVDFVLLPDGQTWVAGLQDGRLQIRRLNDGAVIESVDAYESPLMDVRVSSDNQWIGALYLDEVKIYRQADGAVAYRYPAAAVDFALDARSFALAYDDGRIELRDSSDGHLIQERVAHADRVTAVRYLPTGDLLSAGFDCQLIRWQTPDLLQLGSLENIMVEGADSEEDVPMRVRDFLIMPDGQSVIGLFWGGEFAVWSLPDGAVVREPQWENRVFVSAVSAESRYLAISSTPEQWDDSLLLLDIEDEVAAFSPDSSILASGARYGSAGALQLWRIPEMDLLHMANPQTTKMTAVTFTSDGQLIITAALDGVMRLWGIP